MVALGVSCLALYYHAKQKWSIYLLICQRVHKWTSETASELLLKYNIRKRKKKENSDDDGKSSKKRKHMTTTAIAQLMIATQLCFDFQHTCKKFIN